MSRSGNDRIADAYGLYERRRAKSWDRLCREAEDKNRQEVYQWGSIGGTAMLASIRNLMDQLQQQVEQAAEIWSEICRDVPEFCSDDQIQVWRREMLGMLDSWQNTGIPASVGRVLGVQREPEVREMLRHPEWTARLEAIRAMVEREVGIMTRARRLGTSSRGGNVYIQHSTVGAVNLGNVAGNLTATITTLRTQGSTDLAAALERLRETINATDALAEQRAELIQAVATIADEAKQPADHRKPAVVSVLLDYIRPILVSVAEEVWNQVYPVIAATFGLPH